MISVNKEATLNTSQEMDIVCIPFHDLKVAQKEGFRTRDSHLYLHFSESTAIRRVIIINRPTTVGEILLRKKKLKSHGSVVYKNNGVFITKINEKLFCIDILDASFFGPITEGKGYISKLYSKNHRKISEGLGFLGVKDFITYESSPLTAVLCRKLNPKSRIFDGVDNFCKHPTYQKYRNKIHDAYIDIIKSYEFVYFNSKDSITYFKVENTENVQFLSNGVDFERFRGNKDLPEIFKELQRPIVTYAGKMQELFDIELVRSIATSFQSCTFLFIGKIFNKNIKTELFNCKNVIFGGDINYELLPNYICNSDVCIIPYNINNQHGGDPIKFYEYMAAGKPVVSTRIGEIDKYHNGSTIFICSRDDFLPSLDVALSCKDVIKNDLPLDLTWKYKAEYMLERVLNGNHDS